MTGRIVGSSRVAAQFAGDMPVCPACGECEAAIMAGIREQAEGDDRLRAIIDGIERDLGV